MAFRKPLPATIRRFITPPESFTDEDIEIFIDSNSDVVTTYNVSDSKKHHAVIQLTMTDIRFNALSRETEGEVILEKRHAEARDSIFLELKRFSTRHSRLGDASLSHVIEWYSATGDDRTFTAADFTGTAGKKGSGDSITFTPFTASQDTSRYFAIAVNVLIDSLRIGGNIDQLPSFPRLEQQLTIDGSNFFIYTSDSKIFAEFSNSVYEVTEA